MDSHRDRLLCAIDNILTTLKPRYSKNGVFHRDHDDVVRITREHDVSLGYGSQIQSTTDNNDEDQHDPQVNRGRHHRRRGCGTAGHL
uniref:Uncharacterized protein n=1 Tax=Medicago truncatula TaxID=3880 RepID=Q2HTH8_MEDTR|nr:hypothetical protein MtrDRAFT_AC150441g11v1 [Medicago truncatula]